MPFSIKDRISCDGKIPFPLNCGSGNRDVDANFSSNKLLSVAFRGRQSPRPFVKLGLIIGRDAFQTAKRACAANHRRTLGYGIPAVGADPLLAQLPQVVRLLIGHCQIRITEFSRLAVQPLWTSL